MKALAKFVLLSFVLTFCAQTAFADDFPPSQENACDDLQLPGVSGGLFGLCNAYCEAKDCDEYPVGEEPRSCTRILANYNNRRDVENPMDVEMPCTIDPSPTCPCWTPDQFAGRNDGFNPLDCGDSMPGFEFGLYFDDGFANSQVFGLNTAPGCFYMNDIEGVTFERPGQDGPALEPDEAAACAADVAVILAEFADAGVTCTF